MSPVVDHNLWDQLSKVNSRSFVGMEHKPGLTNRSTPFSIAYSSTLLGASTYRAYGPEHIGCYGYVHYANDDQNR